MSRNLMPLLWKVVTGKGGGVTPLTYLLRDEFTTDESAPITSPRTCEPGPGTLTVVDASNEISISGGNLVVSALGGPECALYSTSAITRDPGVAFFIKDINHDVAKSGAAAFGLGLAYATLGRESGFYFYPSSSKLRPFDGGSLVNNNLVSVTRAENYSFLSILRSVGSFYIGKGKNIGDDSTMSLLWVGNSGTGTPLDVNGYIEYSSDVDETFDEMSIIDLPANGYSEWDADFSTVTDKEVNPSANTNMDCEADFHMKFEVTPSGSTCDTYYRIVDSNNRFVMQIRADNGISMWEIVDNVGKNLGTAYPGLATGVPGVIDLVCEGNSHKVYFNNVIVHDITNENHLTAAAAMAKSPTPTCTYTIYPYPSLGIATDRVIAPQDEMTATHTDDLLSYTRDVTLGSVATIRFRYRYADSSNNNLIQFTSGGRAEMYEYRTAGNPQRISTGNGTVSDGDDVCIVMEGANCEIFVNNTLVGSTSAIDTILTGTSVYSSDGLPGSDGHVDSIELFPRDVSSLLPAELV